jgi:hypothetical protein
MEKVYKKAELIEHSGGKKKEVCSQLYQLTMRFPFYLLLGQIGIESEKLAIGVHIQKLTV